MQTENTVEKISKQMKADNLEIQAQYEAWLLANKRFQRDKTGALIIDGSGAPIIEKTTAAFCEFRKTLVRHDR